MKKILFLLVFVSTLSQAQRLETEILVGVTGYSGDLASGNKPFNPAKPGVNVNLDYWFNQFVAIRGGIGYGKISGQDKGGSDTFLVRRNLSFETDVYDASIGLQVNLLNPWDFKVFPYVFAGVGVFHFDPKARDAQNNLVSLRDLSTEGQGLEEFPNRKPYKLTQLCLPFAVGVKTKFSDRFGMAAEIAFRPTFTDYLDDVSTTYADFEVLLTKKGEKATKMAFRGDELSRPLQYPQNGTIRGNPRKNDWYYYGGIKFTFLLGKIKKYEEQDENDGKKKRKKKKQEEETNEAQF
ncbi:MAG: DUF6089 family protein [Chitinophagaceae bacterium]|nr:DUF6089 family protein [Chitinophagaceae bacterium]